MNDQNKNQNHDLVTQAVEALRQSSISPGPPAEVLETVLAAGSGLDEALRDQQQNKRIRLMKTLSKMAAVLILAAGIVGIIGVFHPFGGRNVAFADVIDPFLTARTVICNVTVGQMPPTKILNDDYRVREELATGQIVILNVQEMTGLVLDAKKKTATVLNLKGAPSPQENFLERMRTMIKKVENNPKVTIEALGERVIDGQKAAGFHAIGDNVDFTIWADPQTELPIRAEYNALGQTYVVMTDFEFGQDLDPALFSMDIPEGYQVQQPNVSFENLTESDLIYTLRTWAETIKDDGVFPNTLDMGDFQKQAMQLDKKIKGMNLSEQEEMEFGIKIVRGLVFVQTQCKDWHYAGAGVKLGDAETAIFWYHLKDAANYRVIYGDLSVEDVTPENLPQPPAPAKKEIVGTQEDHWHILPGDRIKAISRLKILNLPDEEETLTITLPYAGGELKSVMCDSLALKHTSTTAGVYQIDLGELPASQKYAELECSWEMNLSALATEDYGFRTELKSLIPVTAYRLNVVLEPGCGWENPDDVSQRTMVPFFCFNRPKPVQHMGSCGIKIRQQTPP